MSTMLRGGMRLPFCSQSFFLRFCFYLFIDHQHHHRHRRRRRGMSGRRAGKRKAATVASDRIKRSSGTSGDDDTSDRDYHPPPVDETDDEVDDHDEEEEEDDDEEDDDEDEEEDEEEESKHDRKNDDGESKRDLRAAASSSSSSSSSSSASSSSSSSPAGKQRFANVDSDTLKQLESRIVPKATADGALWARNVWQQWRAARGIALDFEPGMDVAPLIPIVARFFAEVRTRSGEPYGRLSYTQLMINHQRWARGVMASDTVPCYVAGDTWGPVRNVIDAELRRMAISGAPEKQSALPFTASEQQRIDAFLMESITPQRLFWRAFFVVSVHCGLRGGAAHHNLRRSDFKLGADEHGPFITYHERQSKNYKAGQCAQSPPAHRLTTLFDRLEGCAKESKATAHQQPSRIR